MATDQKSRSPSPIPTTEPMDTDANPDESSTVNDEEWQAMQTVLNNVYDYRDPETDRDPSKMFHRRVNKRAVPDYYDVIKEPVALSSIKANINQRTYKSFSEFTREFALVSHNAQLYNRPEAIAYQDALVLRTVVQSELKKLVEQKIISEETATLPDLGEIPPPSPRAAEEEGEEEDEEDEDEDEEEGDDSDEDNKKKRKRRGPRPSTIKAKGETVAKAEDEGKGNEAESRKRRGRPPRVDTPMEARIKAVLKGLRKFKGTNGELKVAHFERLPDKGLMPEYFNEIKNPMALDLIKRKAKRKKYQSVDHFMKDVEVMFENAKMYNQDESQIYRDAVDLQHEARLLAEQEKKKPDTDYVMEDGRLPLPNGILHNGELWKVGDWVHIQNPNDVTKPIVAQIYRTWQDLEGQKWVNACWYYRPEQTVHRAERHFFEQEVVKTGQYRDHHIDEVVDRCFVMFFTRFNKGRPRGFPPDKEVYVCESRYNEEKFKLNKIKTWASCLPDEVREKDYEMDLFEAPRKMKKVPSPIKHLLPAEAKETDDIPKPKWGVENAPPIIGAVHKRPREANESPPPEPTPSPPPQPPPAPARPAASLSNQLPEGGLAAADSDVTMGGTNPLERGASIATPTTYNFQPSYKSHNASASQASIPHSYGTGRQASTYAKGQSQSDAALTPPITGLNQGTASYSTPHGSTGYTHASSTAAGRPSHAQSTSYNPPRPAEVYHLSDSANLAIPADIREQFHCDEHGRILFFTTPPLDPLPPPVRNGGNGAAAAGQAVGHSVRYLAEKARRASEKRKQADANNGAPAAGAADLLAKKARHDEGAAAQPSVEELKLRALTLLESQMLDRATQAWREVVPGGASEKEVWDGVMAREVERVERLRAKAAVEMSGEGERARERREEEIRSGLREGPVFLDDVEGGY